MHGLAPTISIDRWVERNVAFGSKPEKLSVSRCFPLCPPRTDIERPLRHVRFVPIGDMERLAGNEMRPPTEAAISLALTKPQLRRTQYEHMFSALPSNSDIARCVRHVSKVPKSATFVPPRFPLLLCRWHQYGRSALQRAGKNFKTQELDLHWCHLLAIFT